MYTSCHSVVSRYFPDHQITTAQTRMGQFILVDGAPFVLVSLGFVAFNDEFYRTHYKFYRALMAYCARNLVHFVREDFKLYKIKF